MNEIYLLSPSILLKDQVLQYREEHFSHGEKLLHGGALLDQIEDYEEWLENCKRNSNPETVNPDWVVSSTFVVIRKSDDKMIGLIDIRHYLNDFLKEYGGHIGYGVRPTERNKGYASQLLKLGLVYCRKLGLDQVMLACYKDNIASRRTILKNGGKLEKEFDDKDGNTVQVFLIYL